jgi:hypothetical protein
MLNRAPSVRPLVIIPIFPSSYSFCLHRSLASLSSGAMVNQQEVEVGPRPERGGSLSSLVTTLPVRWNKSCLMGRGLVLVATNTARGPSHQALAHPDYLIIGQLRKTAVYSHR